MTRGFVFVFENDPSHVARKGVPGSLILRGFVVFQRQGGTIHVDDGRCGGDEVFSQKIKELHRLYPISLRFRKGGFVCVFTGIQLHQRSDKAHYPVAKK